MKTIYPVLLVTVAFGLQCRQAAADIVIVGTDEDHGITYGASGSHDILVPSSTHGHDAHYTWNPTAPPSGSVVQVTWFLDNHGGANALTAAQEQRIRDAAAVWNAAGANVQLVEVFSDGAADIHVHGDSTSGCGVGAIGCAEFAFFTAHSGTYGDGHDHHHMASNQDGFGVLQELTQLTRSDWYTGADPSGISGSELDYMTVAIQEFGHHLGLEHNSGTNAHGDSANSPMNGGLPPGVTRRVLQPADIAALQHLYGVAAEIPEPSSCMLFGLGALGMVAGARRRKRSA